MNFMDIYLIFFPRDLHVFVSERIFILQIMDHQVDGININVYCFKGNFFWTRVREKKRVSIVLFVHAFGA